MRCAQKTDATTETQVGYINAPCGGDIKEQAQQCAEATYESIYSYGTKMIEFGGSASLNCIQAARDAGVSSPETTTEPGPVLYLGTLTFGAFVATVVVGGAFFLALLVGGLLLVYRHKKRQPMLDAVCESETYPLSPPKRSVPGSAQKTSPTSTTMATPRKNRSVLQSQIMEQAVNDLA